MQDVKFDSQLGQKRRTVNNTLQRLMAEQVGIDSDLNESLIYTLKAPGKRIRGALLLWCCELISGAINRDAEIAAAAIEMVHTSSLVHDDLPAMDNDDLRRGQPTCHKVFGEATAILTGDALIILAFEVLAKYITEPAIATNLIRQLAEAAGASGMISGQMADLRAEDAEDTMELLQYIHVNKTAKMFRCAAAMGAICGGAKKNQLDQLCEYGLKVGLGFQIADDILDVCATSEQLGKTAGKDAKASKCTYPSLLGVEKSGQLAKKLAGEAVAVLKPFGPKAELLRQLVITLLGRTR